MQAGLLPLAEAALRSWQPQLSGFLDGADREQATTELGRLGDLSVRGWGGFAGAERQRLLLARHELELPVEELLSHGLIGLELLGNFLFDPAEPAEFRAALLLQGLPPEALGDLWLRGDRGAQGIALGTASAALEGLTLSVRSVEVSLQQRPLASLQLPQRRQPRQCSSVEASLRLDAVGSAGFGLSRSRMAALIRQGAVRINWQPVNTPSKELCPGDRVQLEGRGELVLEGAERTKTNRWRVALSRQ